MYFFFFFFFTSSFYKYLQIRSEESNKRFSCVDDSYLESFGFFLSDWLCVFFVTSDMLCCDDQSDEWAWMSQPSPKGFDHMTGWTWTKVPNHCIQWLFGSPRAWLTESKLKTHKNATRQPCPVWDQCMGQDQQIWWTFGNDCTVKFSSA